MTYNWITIILGIIVIGSVFYGAARGFGRESRLVIWQILSICIGIASVIAGWFASHRIASFVLHQNTDGLPHWLAHLLTAWQRAPQVGMWISFLICYLILSSVLHRTIGLMLMKVPIWLPVWLQESRILGGMLGGAMGIVRCAVIGAMLFIVLQYLSLPVIAKQASQSRPYQTLQHQVYEPWLQPLVARELPVFAQSALQPIAQNIDLFAVPSGSNGQETGILLVPKQIAALSHRLTKNAKTPKEKAKALYEWEIKHVKYDWKKYDDYVYHHHWDAQSPLQTLQTGKGVCADYALLYADLAHAAGLKVRIDEGIGGTGHDYGSHAWNEAYLPKKKQWIMIDTTWGATQDAWFDVPPAKFRKTHILQTSITIDASAHV